MNILHVLDHSLPIHSGYAFRTKEILHALSEMGYDVSARTGPKHNQESGKEVSDEGALYRRSAYANRLLADLPILNQLEVIRILRRDMCNIDLGRPVDLIHAHSPSLNGLAAIWAAKSQNIPWSH